MPDARGPLAQIADATTRKEIGKLWGEMESRMPIDGKAPQSQTLVTYAQLLALETSLTRKVNALVTPGQTQTVLVGTGGGTSGSGSGSNLLPLDNTWTGTNTFQRLLAGPLFVPGSTTLVGPSFKDAVVSIDKTSSIGALNASTALGGTAGLYVQHRATGTAPLGISSLSCAIRAQMQTDQSGLVGQISNVVAGAFSVYHRGAHTSAVGVQVETIHAAAGTTSATGVNVDLLRDTFASQGNVTGVHVRVTNAGLYTGMPDYGVLVGPLSGFAAIGTAFSVGQSGSTFNCKVGLDFSHATCTTAAIQLAVGQKMMIGNNDLLDSVGSLHANTLWLNNDANVAGGVACGNLLIQNAVFRTGPDLTPTAGGVGMHHQAYFAIRLGNSAGAISRVWIPYFVS